jgi:undecaprenyl-diphosphatase
VALGGVGTRLLEVDVALARAANTGARRTGLGRGLVGMLAARLAVAEVTLMVLLLPGGKRRSVARMLAAVAVVYAASEALGRVLPRERPFVSRAAEIESLTTHGGGRSFPSRHVASGLAMALVGRRTHPGLGAVMALVAVVLGLSRVAAGLHYPSDVIAGAAIGLAVGGLLRQDRD